MERKYKAKLEFKIERNRRKKKKVELKNEIRNFERIEEENSESKHEKKVKGIVLVDSFDGKVLLSWFELVQAVIRFVLVPKVKELYWIV